MHTLIVDSSSAHHVSHNLDAFIKLDTSVQHFVNLPNGSTFKVGGIGQIVINATLTL